MIRAVAILVLLLSPTSLPLARGAQAGPPPGQDPDPSGGGNSSAQILRAPDWKGAVQVSRGECGAADGEFTFWVYSTATRCGVLREEAERVVLVRQATLGVAPLTAKAELPEGRYAVWVYGAADPGRHAVEICGKTCVTAPLPGSPGWAFLDRIEIRDNQLLFVRTLNQPLSHRLHVQAVVLAKSDAAPDWLP